MEKYHLVTSDDLLGRNKPSSLGKNGDDHIGTGSYVDRLKLLKLLKLITEQKCPNQPTS